MNTKLPETLNINFDQLYRLRPEENSSVLVYDKKNKKHNKKEIFRAYNSYLKTPSFDSKIEKSYMFLNKDTEIPKEILPFVEFAKTLDKRYNQLVVNWYDKEDYIEPHRDCTSKMISPDSPILTINLNESDDPYKLRHLTFENVNDGEISSIPLLNKHYYIIKNNQTHRHYVGKGLEKRISLTFRMIK